MCACGNDTVDATMDSCPREHLGDGPRVSVMAIVFVALVCATVVAAALTAFLVVAATLATTIGTTMGNTTTTGALIRIASRNWLVDRPSCKVLSWRGAVSVATLSSIAR